MAETYRRLNAWDPLEWEHHVYETKPLREGLDRKLIGSTTHMAVEAALDWMAFKMRRIEKDGWCIVYSNDRSDDRERILDVLDKVFNLHLMSEREVQVMSEMEFGKWDKCGADRLMLYVDHYAVNPLERITGPHRLVRAIRRAQNRPDRFLLVNRDSGVVAETHSEGVDRVLSLASCPVYDARTNILVNARAGHEL